MIIMPDADLNQAVDALIGAGYGSAGERCMAISVAVPVGERHRGRIDEAAGATRGILKIGPSTDTSADYGPLVTQRGLEACAQLCRDRHQGGRDAGSRRPQLQNARL